MLNNQQTPPKHTVCIIHKVCVIRNERTIIFICMDHILLTKYNICVLLINYKKHNICVENQGETYGYIKPKYNKSFLPK